MRHTDEALQGQSFIDLTIQETGSVESLVAMAVLNNRSITTTLKIGQILSKSEVRNQRVVNFMAPVNKKPATEVVFNEFIKEKQEGISFWAIGVDFVVSNSLQAEFEEL